MNRDAETRAALERISASNSLRCGDATFEIWRDFDTEETRIRTASGAKPVRIDEDALCDRLNELERETTDDQLRELLCAIATHPDRYGRLVVWKPINKEK